MYDHYLFPNGYNHQPPNPELSTLRKQAQYYDIAPCKSAGDYIHYLQISGLCNKEILFYINLYIETLYENYHHQKSDKDVSTLIADLGDYYSKIIKLADDEVFNFNI